mmetsp:Transcript_4391/g.5600  ORF Transcript_4391/g.5600 Transcript_4391/m.5600 type:complete len:830 (+) Transcript_4391:102-2591(+)|eukprot:CAMPEP_0172487000 /NCGR_PEP_ID=MMETSP1066-20121228/15817_1 /TAXON_ID=671091 /ORGANISM="Coscinodiscus wailesii, Strain CCMP2513" /LENGTH=829 /DNA_ID=CAMNT_0013253321 /DNA_START=101 /DNA_END=2590 /DNA_ORIENTATION=-
MHLYVSLFLALLQCRQGSSFIQPSPTSFHVKQRHALSRHVLSSSSTEQTFEFSLKNENPDDMPPRLRFAPSPTGSLHVGGARTALYNWLVAKKGQLDYPNSEGAFVVRVEDTDLERSTKESEESVLADLKWLGLHWDEGPDSTSARGPYRQSERSVIYKTLAQRLLDEGKAYRCFCTKEELEEMKARQEAAGEQTRYDGTWRDADPALVEEKLAQGCEYTVRFKVPKNARVVIDDVVRGTVSWDAEATVGDFILLRSSGVPVYNFCVAVDDALMGITTVIRAEEHLTNTLRQGLILDALGAHRPQYAHCSLILGEDKQKLSKRHGATSCNQYRIDGYLPDAMINYLALLGWSEGTEEEIYRRDDLIECFDIDRVNKSPSVFDIEKLNWINSQHIKMLSMEELIPHVKEQVDQLSVLKDSSSDQNDDFIWAITALAKQMMITTKDAVTNSLVVLDYKLPSKFDDLDEEAKGMVQKGYFYNIAKTLIESYENGELPLPDDDLMVSFLDPNQANNYKQANGEQASTTSSDEKSSFPQKYKAYMKTVSKELKIKGKNLFHPIRLALTGEMSGQDVTKQLALVKMAKSVISDDVTIIDVDQRINVLKTFLDTIPEEYRVAPDTNTQNTKANETSKEKKTQKQDKQLSQQDTSAIDDPLSTYTGPPITALDIRVGYIKNAYEHPEADKLYIEEIDVGEDELRTITSGLRPYIPSASELTDRKCLVVCNLKSRKMLGVDSHGMVLCASNDDHSVVKLLNPPVDAIVGERVTVSGINFEGEEGEPFGENKVGKKKVLEKVSEFMRTNGETGTAEFMGRVFLTSAGVCTSSVRGGTIS